MVLTVELVLMIFAPVSVAVGVMIWFFRIIGGVKENIIASKEVSLAKTKEVEKSLSEHKLYAAEHYATKSGLIASLNRVHDSIDSLASRIDEFLTKLSEK